MGEESRDRELRRRPADLTGAPSTSGATSRKRGTSKKHQKVKEGTRDSSTESDVGRKKVRGLKTKKKRGKTTSTPIGKNLNTKNVLKTKSMKPRCLKSSLDIVKKKLD